MTGKAVLEDCGKVGAGQRAGGRRLMTLQARDWVLGERHPKAIAGGSGKKIDLVAAGHAALTRAN